MQKKIFYPDRYSITKWYLVFAALFMLTIGIKTHFSTIFCILAASLLPNLVLLGAMYRVSLNLDDRTVTTMGVNSIIEKISIDNIEYNEIDTPKGKNIVLTDRVTNKSVKIIKSLFTENTLNEIRLIIKTKAILGG